MIDGRSLRLHFVHVIRAIATPLQYARHCHRQVYDIVRKVTVCVRGGGVTFILSFVNIGQLPQHNTLHDHLF